MEDWQYRFPQITKEEWLTRVSTDLKGKPVSSLDSEWWPGETMHPFYHKEDVEATPLHLPARLFSQPPTLTEWIDTRDRNPGDVNSEILTSLQYGAQSILLYTGHEPIAFPKILKGVIQDYLSISVEAEDASVIDMTAIPSNIKVRIKDGISNSGNVNTRWVYDIPSEGSWTSEAIIIFQKIIQHMTDHGHDTSVAGNIVLRYSPGNDFLKQIIQTRVIHSVWQKILAANNISTGQDPAYLECHIEPNGQTDPDKYLIAASSSALAASMTGVHAVCIHHQSKDMPGYYKRISRNIAHLLALESEMYRGVDPLAGSYAIDFYTRKWTSDIWDRLSL